MRENVDISPLKLFITIEGARAEKLRVQTPGLKSLCPYFIADTTTFKSLKQDSCNVSEASTLHFLPTGIRKGPLFWNILMTIGLYGLSQLMVAFAAQGSSSILVYSLAISTWTTLSLQKADMV